MSYLHIIYIPFRDVGINDPFHGDNWFAERISIFRDYTLKSLCNQSNRSFVVWMSFTKQDEGSDLVGMLDVMLTKSGIRHVFTFDGLMFWDDKFGGHLIHKTKNFLRILRRCIRNKQLDRFSVLVKKWRENEQKNETLWFRLSNSLLTIEEKLPLNDAILPDYVLLTRLDSDDMFHKDAIRDIQMQGVLNEAIAMKLGYVFDKSTNRLAEWNPLTTPPFYTIVFTRDVFFNASKHLGYYGKFRSHEDIPDVFSTAYFHDRKYCVLIHSWENQISTIWNHHFRGQEILDNKEKHAILTEFGIV